MNNPTVKVIWVSTRNRACGIADYSQALFGKLGQQWKGEVVWVSLDAYQDLGLVGLFSGKIAERVADAILEKAGTGPALVHFQHEYGIFGGKNPPGYFFPKLVAILRKRAGARLKLVATVHTVLGGDYRYKYKYGTFRDAIERPLRRVLNILFLGHLRSLWGPQSFGALDLVLCHSGLQVSKLQEMGARVVAEVPHFVPLVGEGGGKSLNKSMSPVGSVSRRPRSLPMHPDLIGPKLHEKKWWVVFGFFTPEKGQDIAIEALKILAAGPAGQSHHLILAGGLRRREDRDYYDRCREMIRDFGLREQVTITGFLDNQYLDGLFARADGVIVPFRETSGSGSLAQALARGVLVLASDLELNLELSRRVPGCMRYFKSEDAADLAQGILKLQNATDKGALEKKAALEYAQKYSIESIVEMTVKHYETQLGTVV